MEPKFTLTNKQEDPKLSILNVHVPGGPHVLTEKDRSLSGYSTFVSERKNSQHVGSVIEREKPVSYSPQTVINGIDNAYYMVPKGGGYSLEHYLNILKSSTIQAIKNRGVYDQSFLAYPAIFSDIILGTCNERVETKLVVCRDLIPCKMQAGGRESSPLQWADDCTSRSRMNIAATYVHPSSTKKHVKLFNFQFILPNGLEPDYAFISTSTRHIINNKFIFADENLHFSCWHLSKLSKILGFGVFFTGLYCACNHNIPKFQATYDSLRAVNMMAAIGKTIYGQELPLGNLFQKFFLEGRRPGKSLPKNAGGMRGWLSDYTFVRPKNPCNPQRIVSVRVGAPHVLLDEHSSPAYVDLSSSKQGTLAKLFGGNRNLFNISGCSSSDDDALLVPRRPSSSAKRIGSEAKGGYAGYKLVHPASNTQILPKRAIKFVLESKNEIYIIMDDATFYSTKCQPWKNDQRLQKSQESHLQYRGQCKYLTNIKNVIWENSGKIVALCKDQRLRIYDGIGDFLKSKAKPSHCIDGVEQFCTSGEHDFFLAWRSRKGGNKNTVKFYRTPLTFCSPGRLTIQRWGSLQTSASIRQLATMEDPHDKSVYLFVVLSDNILCYKSSIQKEWKYVNNCKSITVGNGRVILQQTRRTCKKATYVFSVCLLDYKTNKIWPLSKRTFYNCKKCLYISQKTELWLTEFQQLEVRNRDTQKTLSRHSLGESLLFIGQKFCYYYKHGTFIITSHSFGIIAPGGSDNKTRRLQFPSLSSGDSSIAMGNQHCKEEEEGED